jgi:hypothetical protein
LEPEQGIQAPNREKWTEDQQDQKRDGQKQQYTLAFPIIRHDQIPFC